MLGSNRKYFNLFGRIQSTQVYRHSSLRNDFLFCQDIFRASLHVTMLTEGHYGIWNSEREMVRVRASTPPHIRCIPSRYYVQTGTVVPSRPDFTSQRDHGRE